MSAAQLRAGATLAYHGEAVLRRRAEVLFHAIISPQTISAWNPAITSVSAKKQETAKSGDSYRVLIRGLIFAKLTYVLVSPERIDYRLEAARNIETGSWSVTPLSNSKVLIQHRFEHQGKLLKLMSGAFTQVASWRLERLSNFAAKQKLSTVWNINTQLGISARSGTYTPR